MKKYLALTIFLTILQANFSFANTTERTTFKNRLLYGVTVTDITPLSKIYHAIRAFHCKPMVRVVFDPQQPTQYYEKALKRLHPIAFIMGGLLDSSNFNQLTYAAYRKRTKRYMLALSPYVDIWEIGNEINGEWLGNPIMVRKKLNYTFRLANKLHEKTALTFYYNKPCYKYKENEMFHWIAHYLPKKIKQNLNYALISYYPDDCHNKKPNWLKIFKRLHKIFPKAKIGFGEVGSKHEKLKAKYIDEFYQLTLPVKNYIGGYFWWYFNTDMIPSSKKHWKQLNNLMIYQTPNCKK